MTAMIHCNGCGFNVERKDSREFTEYDDPGYTRDCCDACAKCTDIPELREAYRRGFNAGVDAMAKAVVGVIEKKNELRKR